MFSLPWVVGVPVGIVLLDNATAPYIYIYYIHIHIHASRVVVAISLAVVVEAVAVVVLVAHTSGRVCCMGCNCGCSCQSTMIQGRPEQHRSCACNGQLGFRLRVMCQVSSPFSSLYRVFAERTS